MTFSVQTPLLFSEGAAEETAVAATPGAEGSADAGIGPEPLPVFTGDLKNCCKLVGLILSSVTNMQNANPTRKNLPSSTYHHLSRVFVNS